MARKLKHDNITQGIPELDIAEDWQSLFLLPSSFDDLSNLITDFSRLRVQGSKILVEAEVAQVVGYDKNNNVTKSPYPVKRVLVLFDGKGFIDCDVFGADFKDIEQGDRLTLLAVIKHSSYRNGLYLTQPERSAYSPFPRVNYTGISGSISGSVVGFHAQNAMKDAANIARAKEWLCNMRPALVRMIGKHWEGSIESLFQQLHAPKTVSEGARALAFAKRLCMAEIRYNGRISQHRATSIDPFPRLRVLVWEAIQKQPETPSPGQLNAFKAAVPALSGNKPARILINGDVGSGKTLVFLSIVAGFAADARPCAILAPSEQLASQIHQQFRARFPNISCNFVAGDGERPSTQAMVWIGTTALLFVTERPEFALVVVDEQHKYSREQREALLSPHTHLIEASATPIPRSMALALFDGCTLAQIAKPPVNKNIRSHLVDKEGRGFIASLHHRVIKNGHRVIYLYAAVKDRRSKAAADSEDVLSEKEQGKESLRAAKTAYEDLAKAFPDKVAIVHGQMPAEQAGRELALFRAGEKPILVSSTAIEVGIDVPDVRLMVVNDADRFGIAQLHQLRGRLARNGGEADFVMHTKKQLAKDALARLNAVRMINDGFELAEKDLEIRGFGEVAGDIQSGATSTTFKLNRIAAADFLKQG